MFIIPLVPDRHLENRFICCLTFRTCVGNITAGHTSAAVILCSLIGIAICTGMISVFNLRRERVLLDIAFRKDNLLVICGSQQTAVCILIRRFKSLFADSACDCPVGHIVLAGSIDFMSAQFTVGARFGIDIQLRAVIFNSLYCKCLFCRIYR